MTMFRQGTLLVFLIASVVCHGQGKLVKSIPLNGRVHFASVDRPGDLYIVMEDGLVRKFDLNGNEIATKKFASVPTLFDPRDGTLSFAYFRGQQKLEYLSPDMSSSVEKQLPAEFAVSPWLACPSKNELWILDSADLSLRQTAGRATSVAYDVNWKGEKPLPTSLGYMREYQNFLFVLDKERGIHMFNNLGRKIRMLGDPGITYFNFLGEELYYQGPRSIQFMDLYTGEAREIPLPYPCAFALLTDLRMILLTEGKVEFLEFTP